ncbi:MAG: HPr family phosphocarrier protein [Pseudomonadota bacterium]
MKELIVRVCNDRGLHARPSAQFSSVAKKFDCRVTVTASDRSADGKSIMGLLTLAATQNSRLVICLVGPQAAEAAEALLEQCSDTICLDAKSDS